MLLHTFQHILSLFIRIRSDFSFHLGYCSFLDGNFTHLGVLLTKEANFVAANHCSIGHSVANREKENLEAASYYRGFLTNLRIRMKKKFRYVGYTN